jgi:uroporphyrinogen III methyltransferase/synthase
MKPGKVYLVGAGPGDPGLITVKGLACLRQADVVIYDRLVDESILKEVRPEAEKIYVGKAASHHTLEQEAINELLLKKVRDGKSVVRLKGGDPFGEGRRRRSWLQTAFPSKWCRAFHRRSLFLPMQEFP